MSETVYYKGFATKIEHPNDKTAIDAAKKILKQRDVEIEDYYSNALECLCDNFYKEFFYHPKTDTLYQLDNTKHEPDEEIIRAHKNKDGVIEYELRYYNGGAGFEECLEKAFDKLQQKKY